MRTHPHQIVSAWPSEEWRRVVDRDDYFVSNLGRVCSIDRVVVRSDGRERFCPGVLLSPTVQESGHLYVSTGNGNKRRVHVLVLETFVGPCPDGYEALHQNDDPTNNELSNLRWGTRSDNIYDGIRNGKIPIGEAKIQAKLTDDAVRFIHASPEMGLRELGRRFGVSGRAVKNVRDGISWKHVA